MSERSEKFGDMPTADFRKFGYQIIDQLADYFDSMENYPVLSQVEPDWLKSNLPASAPEAGEDFGEILGDVDRLIMPAVTHWNHPNFHGLFSTSTSSSARRFGLAFAQALIPCIDASCDFNSPLSISQRPMDL